ncbi:MAG: TonB family protein [Armatimonadetes bacterium]|nr:TonB family protein [Armatimonadota bacterium]
MSLPAYYFYRPRRKDWRRMRLAVVLAILVNVAVMGGISLLMGRFAEETIYEVHLADKMSTDARVEAEKPKTRLTLDPAKVNLTTEPRRKATVGGGAPAPAPGRRPDNPQAQAPPPLLINQPPMQRDSGPTDPDSSIVGAAPVAPDASLKGNPEGVTGGRGNEEGPGGTGTGGTGLGGTGTGTGTGTGPGDGPGNAPLFKLVNRVDCKGCHNITQRAGTVTSPHPIEIERLFMAVHWKSGGERHPMVLRVTLNDQGYVEEVSVTQSSGRADIDESAIQFVRLTKWVPAMMNGTQPIFYECEMPLDTYY